MMKEEIQQLQDQCWKIKYNLDVECRCMHMYKLYICMAQNFTFFADRMAAAKIRTIKILMQHLMLMDSWYM